MSEVVLAAAGAKTSITEKAQTDATLGSAGAGITIATGGKVGSATVTTNGIIEVGANSTAVGTVVTVKLSPSLSNGKVLWACSAGASSQFKYLPAECRH